MTGSISFATDIRLARKQPRTITFALTAIAVLCPILFWQSDSFSINEVLAPAVSLTYWLAISMAVLIQALVSTLTVQALLPNPSRLVFWISRFANAVLNVALASVASIGMKHFWGLPVGEQHDFGGSLMIAAIPVVLVLGLVELGVAARRTPATPSTPITPRASILKRMPRGVFGPVELLRSEDHYLHVQTASGTGMIKYRLSDAIAELGANAGLQVHKSWWVSYAVISGVERRNGRFWVVLRDGGSVPVSRTYLPRLQKRWREEISGQRL